MECQNLFSLKKNIINLLSAEVALRAVMVKTTKLNNTDLLMLLNLARVTDNVLLAY